MNKKILIIALFLLISTASIVDSVSASKVLRSSKKSVKTSTAKALGIEVIPRLRKDRRALIVYFKNLNAAGSVSYNLSYTGSGQLQGVFGTIDTKGKYSLSREFVFGAASAGVYKYDTNVKNAVLVITAKLKKGKTQIMRFKIKV